MRGSTGERRFRRPIVAAVTAAVATLLVAGCGGGGETGDGSARSVVAEETSIQIVSKSTDRTTGGGTARMEMRSAMSLGSSGAPVVLMSGEGTVDFDTGRAVLTLTSQGLVDEMEVRQIDQKTGFVSMPFLELPEGKRWVRIDVEQSPEAGFASGSDAEGTLALIQGLTGEPEEVGRETLHGAETTHYAVDIDVDRLFDIAAENADQLSGQLESLMSTSRQMLPDTLDGNVWIDDEGRIRKFEYVISIEAMGQEAASITTVEYYDFGVEVGVEEPPADEVVAWEEIRDQYEALLGGAVSGDLEF